MAESNDKQFTLEDLKALLNTDPTSVQDSQGLLETLRGMRTGLVTDRLANMGQGLMAEPEFDRVEALLRVLSDSAGLFGGDATASNRGDAHDLERMRYQFEQNRQSVGQYNARTLASQEDKALNRLESLIKDREDDLKEFAKNNRKEAADLVDLITRDPDAARYALEDPDGDKRSRLEEALDEGRKLGFDHPNVRKAFGELSAAGKQTTATKDTRSDLKEFRAAARSTENTVIGMADDLAELGNSKEALKLSARLKTAQASRPEYGGPTDTPAGWDAYNRELLAIKAEAGGEIGKDTGEDTTNKVQQDRFNDINSATKGYASYIFPDGIPSGESLESNSVYQDAVTRAQEGASQIALVQSDVAKATTKAKGIKSLAALRNDMNAGRAVSADEVEAAFADMYRISSSPSVFQFGDYGEYANSYVDAKRQEALEYQRTEAEKLIRDLKDAGLLTGSATFPSPRQLIEHLREKYK